MGGFIRIVASDLKLGYNIYNINIQNIIFLTMCEPFVSPFAYAAA